MDANLLHGTMDMLILEILSRAPSYGYDISQTVMSRSEGYFELKEGSLYPALHRLERQKLLSAFWVNTEEGRRRKYYKLTAAGQKTLAKKRETWTQFTTSVNGVLGPANALA